MRRAWQGELGLGATFWGLAVLASLALCSAYVAVVQASDSLVLGALGLPLVLGWQGFCAVAVWRAAARHGGPAAHRLGARLAVAALNLALVHAAAVLVGIV